MSYRRKCPVCGERKSVDAFPTYGIVCAACGGEPGRRGDRICPTRPRTESRRSLQRALDVLGPAEYPDGVERPRTRGDCVGGVRPCPFVSCVHHLYLEVTRADGVRIMFPDRALEDMPETCALDVADRGGATLEEIGEFLNTTRERVRQVEADALEKMATHPTVKRSMIAGFTSEIREEAGFYFPDRDDDRGDAGSHGDLTPRDVAVLEAFRVSPVKTREAVLTTVRWPEGPQSKRVASNWFAISVRRLALRGHVPPIRRWRSEGAA